MTRMADQTVYDVVVRLPKTLGVEATVGDARAALDDDHVHILLITEAGQLLGTLVRDDLPSSADDASLALPYTVMAGRTIAPETSVERARDILLSQGERRRAVVDRSGQLLGLLCLKRSQTGFCSDGDVRARALARSGTAEPGSAGTCRDPVDGA